MTEILSNSTDRALRKVRMHGINEKVGRSKLVSIDRPDQIRVRLFAILVLTFGRKKLCDKAKRIKRSQKNPFNRIDNSKKRYAYGALELANEFRPFKNQGGQNYKPSQQKVQTGMLVECLETNMSDSQTEIAGGAKPFQHGFKKVHWCASS